MSKMYVYKCVKPHRCSESRTQKFKVGDYLSCHYTPTNDLNDASIHEGYDPDFRKGYFVPVLYEEELRKTYKVPVQKILKMLVKEIGKPFDVEKEHILELEDKIMDILVKDL